MHRSAEEMRVSAGISEVCSSDRLITRLCDGRDVVISKQRAAERLEILCRALDRRRYDLVIILSTGLFREFESSWPMVNAQRAMDASIEAVAAAGQTVGVIYPLRRQLDENAGDRKSTRLNSSH